MYVVDTIRINRKLEMYLHIKKIEIVDTLSAQKVSAVDLESNMKIHRMVKSICEPYYLRGEILNTCCQEVRKARYAIIASKKTELTNIFPRIQRPLL